VELAALSPLTLVASLPETYKELAPALSKSQAPIMKEHPPHERHSVASCPLVCGSVSLVRWAVARFPHASRAAALAALALLFAAIANAAHPLGIRWLPTSDRRVGIPRAYESRLPQISAPEAFTIFQSGKAVFLDSRDAKDFAKDHIPGAINLPMRKWPEAWPKMRSRLPRQAAYVLYCYGGHCGLSTRQGKRLLALGYNSLFVLDYGWDAWTSSGYPTARHPRSKAP